jgi:uncharacterized protein
MTPTADPVPEGLQTKLHQGARLFAVGEWYEAHEAWEAVWMTALGDEREFVQGLILLAAALHKRWHHGSLAHRNYHKALRHLERLPRVYGGVDLDRLRGEVWTALQQEGLYPALRPPAPTAPTCRPDQS